ncbi:MAG TPA: phage tail sheath family protein [Anaerolineae bacterium]|jgi:phage tail sheath protein FI|nr:phage tail sheath family protein [Anaerolineae bacterium]
MATYKTPGVYVEEISKLPPSVAEVSTAVPAFIGCTANGPTADKSGKVVPVVKRIDTLLNYETLFGGPNPSAFTVAAGVDVSQPGPISRVAPAFDYFLYYSLSLYFKNGGGSCYVVSIGNYKAAPAKSQFEAGLAALEKEDEPTLILLTEAINLSPADYYDLAQQALAQCEKLGDRFAILDVIDGKGVADFRTNVGTSSLMYGAAYYPSVQTTLTYVYQEDQVTLKAAEKDGADTNLDASKATNTALYNQVKTALAQQRINLPSSTAIAGIYASVDRDRGVWKAPANVSLSSVIGPLIKITAEDQENLNVDPTAGKSINAIRAFTGKGTLVWGARTLAGNDNEWRYVSVRRLFNMIEESTQKATSFAVFEPNDASTWLKVKAMIESYLYGLWQQGALAGSTAEDAYFVNVGLGKTMTPQDVLEGRMIVEIGVAAVRPAEFIILRFMHKLQQA